MGMKIYRWGLLTACLLLLNLGVQGQDIRYLRGEKFIAHEVKAGETLWAISQRYNSTVEDITKQNPGVGEGLSIGQMLMIPYDRDTKKELKKDPPRILDGDILHTAKKGETLFSLYKRYKVEVEDLIASNPQLNEGLKVGMVVRIPKDKVKTETTYTTPAINDGSKTHAVKAGDTVYGIAKRYNITEKELLDANGGLPEGLRVGSYVRIPVESNDGGEGLATDGPVPSVHKPKYKVAYLLPLSMRQNDTLMAKSKAKGKLAFLQETEAALHFYFGALLALEEKRGMTVDVVVKELNDDAASVRSTLMAPELRDVDIYFGPFHKGVLGQVLNKAATQQAHVVCPTMQDNKVVLGHPELSKVRSTGIGQVGFLANHIAQQHFAHNILLVASPDWKEADLRESMQGALNLELSKYLARRNDSVAVCKLDKELTANLLRLLDPNGMNVLVVPTDQVYHASELMTRLSKLDDELQITVYGLKSWEGFENIDAHYKDRFKLHIPAERSVEYDDPATSVFVQRFRAAHGTDPSAYAFMGYDISLFYLSALQRYGTGFTGYFDQVEVPTLGMDFDMARTGPESGYVNRHLYLLSYEGLQLKRVEP